MNIGYACLAVGVPGTNMKHCLMKDISEDRLCSLIGENLKALENLIDYNVEMGIKLFRISSDIIPFGSNTINNIEWWELFDKQFQIIGNKIRDNRIRISMHPGQYTVLNSPDNGIASRAIMDLNYHAKVLDCLRTGPENKIVLHIGGVYKDKKQSTERFITNYQKLTDSVKKRLVVENDDKSYNICDVLYIGEQLNIPVIFDNLHHVVNSPGLDKSESFWISKCHHTWQEKDGHQKIHYSQQDYDKKIGSHSKSIQIREFMAFYSNLGREDIDIMLEVKDKNLSAIKCINCLSTDKTIKALELEWSRYKYNVLEKSQPGYNEIRKLLKNKTEYPAISFYNVLECALAQPEVVGNVINAAQHVWGYFKDTATTKEQEEFLKRIENYKKGKTNLKTIKGFLWKLAVNYKQQYLLYSYYFIF